MHTGLGGHAVDDVERVVVVQRADTTDTNRGGSRGITIGRDIHAGHSTLHSLDGVVLVLLGQFINADYRDSARQVGLALHLITCHDELVHLGDILAHSDRHAVLGLHLLGVEAHEGDDQRGALLHLQREVAVDVGQRAVVGVGFFLYCGTGQAFTEVVEHGAVDVYLLRPKCSASKNEREAHQQSS